MSEESSIENSLIQNENPKELLYSLFYELTSEVKGQKISIDEENYQMNLQTTSFIQLISYIRETIQILIKKKIQETKQQRIKSTFNNPIDQDALQQYEDIIHQLEAYKRNTIKQQFFYKFQKEAIENQMDEYHQMEEAYEKLKIDVKFEDGRFLDNDRKDNEIIILRSENSNLKGIINQLEHDAKIGENLMIEKEKVIMQLKEDVFILKGKLDKTLKELNLFSNISINIHNGTGNSNGNNGNSSGNLNSGNNTTLLSGKCSFCTCHNNNNNNLNVNMKGGITPIPIDKATNSTHNHNRPHSVIKELPPQYQPIKGHNNNSEVKVSTGGHISIDDKSKGKKKKGHQRNNSMNNLLDKKKFTLISKYFSNQSKMPVKSTQLNNCCQKVARIPIASIQKNSSTRATQLSKYNTNAKYHTNAIGNKCPQNISQKSSVSYSNVSKDINI